VTKGGKVPRTHTKSKRDRHGKERRLLLWWHETRSTKLVIGCEGENITARNSRIILLSQKGLAKLYQRGNDPAG